MRRFAAEGARDYRERPGVVNAASATAAIPVAIDDGAITADGTVFDGQRPLVVDIPSVAEKPWVMVNPERVTWAPALEIVTPVARPPPSTIVVLAPAPSTFKLTSMVRFSP